MRGGNGKTQHQLSVYEGKRLPPHCQVGRSAIARFICETHDESGRADLNRRPPAPKAGALNRAALRPGCQKNIFIFMKILK